ncbi:hypothetical protein [Corynebacterium sp. A21]|uniref:hypothetical protein n=1 Tax=Corynebacterium sp. A21 TaxID=3457318 RepID=UPI003FD393E7
MMNPKEAATEKPIQPYYRSTDPTDPAALWNMQRNRMDLELWTQLAPAMEEDVDTIASQLGNRTGLTKNAVLRWAAIVDLLELYPLIATHNRDLGLLDFPRLKAIENGLIAVTKPEIIAELDRRITTYLTPIRKSQVLPGARAIRALIRKLLAELDPEAAEKESDPRGHGIHFSSDGGGTTRIEMTVPDDQAAEIRKVLAMIAARKKNGTLLGAFLKLIRGELPPRVTFNVYGPVGGKPVYLSGGGWLDDRQSAEWEERVTDVRDMDAAEQEITPAYRPTTGIAQAVKGRDGTCRFPDCTIAAEHCELDHVINHAAGGATAVENLQSLCGHHHNVKTGRRMTASMDKNGVVTWKYPDGTTVVTFPQGPLTKDNKLFGQTFAQRRAKRIEQRRKSHEAPEPPLTPDFEEEPPF